MRQSFRLACALLLLPALSFADEVRLKSGGRISGRILTRSATAVSVDVGPGIITVPMSSVAHIDESHSILDDYEARAARVRPADAGDWAELARWSANAGLGTQARRAWERALAIDSEHPEANRALGRVLVDGRWLSEAEAYRARGYVQFEGSWITASERDDVLTRRESALQVEMARLDAARQIRDADARADEAEARARAAEATAYSSTVGIPLWWGSYGYGYGYPYGQGYGRPHHPKGRTNWQGSGPWSAPLGTWPSSTLGLYPSQPLNGWAPSGPRVERPSRGHGNRPETGPRPAPKPASPSPPVRGDGAGGGARPGRGSR